MHQDFVTMSHTIAVEGQEDIVKNALLRLVDKISIHPSCHSYELYQDTENHQHFVIRGCWASWEAWQKVYDAAVFQEYMTETEGAIETVILNEMTQLI